ncbi:MAG: 30S ribosomal protein S18 [Planctomycetes bacterium]|nr:30S ribosomal protein S18 [Planctomycetota bacterium]
MDRRKSSKNFSQTKKKNKYAELTNKCRFCRMKMEEVDYKDLKYLQKLMGSQSRLLSKRRSGNCSTHQRSVKTALKRARFMALLPYVA